MKNKEANKKKIDEKILKELLYLMERGKDSTILLKKYPGSEDVISDYKKIFNGIRQFSSLGPAQDFTFRSLRDIYALARTGAGMDNGRGVIAAARFRPAFIKPLIVFVSVLVFFVFSFAGTIYASGSSVPGDVLYGVKRAGENMRIAVTPYEKKGGLYKEYLDERLDEAEVILNNSKNVLPEETAVLIKDIDYTYGKCIEHGCLNKDNSEDLMSRLSRVRNRYRQEYIQNNTQAGTGNSMNENCSRAGTQDHESTDSPNPADDNSGSASNKSNNSSGTGESNQHNGNKNSYGSETGQKMQNE